MPPDTKDPERVQLGTWGAHVQHSLYDSRELTAPARKAFLARFVREVEAAAVARGEQLSQAEVERRARHARCAHMHQLAYESAKARRARKTKTGAVSASAPVSEKEGSTSAHQLPKEV